MKGEMEILSEPFAQSIAGMNTGDSLSCGRKKDESGMFKLLSSSSLSLRTIRRNGLRTLDDPIRFKCDVFGKAFRLGKNSFGMMRIEYRFGEEIRNVCLSDKAMDILTDLVIYGPRVVQEGYKWEVRSRMIRSALVEEYLQCVRCLGFNDTHLFIKFDNLKTYGKGADCNSLRICAKCAISYLKLLESSDLSGFKYPMLSPGALTE